MDICTEENSINLTIFHSPDLFWFLYTKDILNRDEFTEKLKRNNNKSPFSINLNPNIGQIILTNYNEQWARAEIIDIEGSFDNSVIYICWLLDYGIFIKSNSVYCIPDKFKIIPAFCKKARLYGLKNTSLDSNGYDWSLDVKEFVAKHLSKLDTVQYFVEKCAIQNILFGNIIIKSIDNKYIDLSEKIVSRLFAKYDANNFLSDIMESNLPTIELSEVFKSKYFHINEEQSIVLSDASVSTFNDHSSSIDSLKSNTNNSRLSVGRGFRKMKTLSSLNNITSSNCSDISINDDSKFEDVTECSSNSSLSLSNSTRSNEHSCLKQSKYNTNNKTNTVTSIKHVKFSCSLSNAIDDDNIESISSEKTDMSSSSSLQTNSDISQSSFSRGRGFRQNSDVKSIINTAPIEIQSKPSTSTVTEINSQKQTRGRGFSTKSEPITDNSVQLNKNDISYDSSSSYASSTSDPKRVGKSRGRGFSKSFQISSTDDENDSPQKDMARGRSFSKRTTQVGDWQEKPNNAQEDSNNPNSIPPTAALPRGRGRGFSTSSVKPLGALTIDVNEDSSCFDDADDSADKSKQSNNICSVSGQVFCEPEKLQDFVNYSPAGVWTGSPKSPNQQNFCEGPNQKRPPQNGNDFPPGRCTCAKCVKWFDGSSLFEAHNDDTNKKPDLPPVVTIKRPRPLLKSDEEPLEYPIQINNMKRQFTSVNEALNSVILIHGMHVVQPTDNIYSLTFNREVINLMRILKLDNPTGIQRYVWPAVMSLHHLFLVAAQTTDKTMAYVPAICSFVMSNRYNSDLPKVNGPRAVILCPGVKIAENVFNVVNKIMCEIRNKIVRLAVPPLDPELKRQLYHGVDILITTPKMLIMLVKEKLISLKRLSHIVIEECSVVMNLFQMEIDTIMEMGQKILMKRRYEQSIQLIVVSKHWTTQMRRLAVRLKDIPTICIGSHLEAALYGRTDIKIKMTPSQMKAKEISDILISKSYKQKTVILYKEKSELNGIIYHLSEKDIEYELVTNNDVEQKQNAYTRWLKAEKENYFVLIYDDDVLNSNFKVTDADIVIQYSLPKESWSQFLHRFSPFLDKYRSPLCKQNKNDTKCEMHIFIDEENTKEFPRMIQFLKRMECELSDDIVRCYNNVILKLEESKLKNKCGVCYNLMNFGSCSDGMCVARHILSPSIDCQSRLPQAGRIKLTIQHISSPTTFYCRLHEHTDVNNVTKPIDNFYSLIVMQLLTAARNSYLNEVPDLHIGLIYVAEINKTYERCKVLEIISPSTISRPARLLVRLIDIGIKVTVYSNNIYMVPTNLKHFPPQVVEVQLVNLTPPHGDTYWPSKSREIVLKEMVRAGYNMLGHHFVAKINLQLSNKIYVDNLVLRETFNIENQEIIANKLNVRQMLLNKELVETRDDILPKLYNLCKNYGFILPDYNLPVSMSTKLSIITEQVQPQWAHLENGNKFHRVQFSAAVNPSTFFIKLQCNLDLLENLKCDIQSALAKPFYPNEFPIIKDRCYLLKDPEGSDYERVILKRIIDDNTVECFFVDYGDFITVDKSELRYLMDKHISQLPFQVIECKLFGIESVLPNKWKEEATDELYKLCYEPNSDYFRTFYIDVKDYEKPSVINYKKYSVILIDAIDDYKIVNNLMIDLNYAKLEVDNVDMNVDLKELQNVIDKNSSDIYDNDENDDDENENRGNEYDGDDEYDEEIDFFTNFLDKKLEKDNTLELYKDLEIVGVEEFLKDLIKTVVWTKPNNNTSNGETNNGNYLPKMKALPPVNFSTPKIIWQQTETELKFKIEVPGVTEYKLNVLLNQFDFETSINSKLYILKLMFFSPVCSTVKHQISGNYVIVTMEKETADTWPRLLHNRDKAHNITYDMEAIAQTQHDSDNETMTNEKFKSSKEYAKLIYPDDQFVYVVGSDENDESDYISDNSSDTN